MWHNITFFINHHQGGPWKHVGGGPDLGGYGTGCNMRKSEDRFFSNIFDIERTTRTGWWIYKDFGKRFTAFWGFKISCTKWRELILNNMFFIKANTVFFSWKSPCNTFEITEKSHISVLWYACVTDQRAHTFLDEISNLWDVAKQINLTKIFLVKQSIVLWTTLVGTFHFLERGLEIGLIYRFDEGLA